MNTLKTKLPEIILAGILALAAFLRLYKINDFITFLGDEGRDALIVKHLLEGDLVFLGPRASAGDFFTGPVYYYMIAPFLWAFRLDPVGPAIMIALLGIATVYLIYRFGSYFFGKTAALFAAGLYAVSPTVVAYSQSSWNPNPMPFFTLLTLYLLFRAVQKHGWKMFLIIGVLYGITFQLHYIEIFVAPMIFFFVLIATLLRERVKRLKILIIRYTLLFIGFLVSMSPFLMFEVYHKFPNITKIFEFIVFGDPAGTNRVDSPFYQTIAEVFFRLFGQLIFHFPHLSEVKSMPFPLLTVWGGGIILAGLLSILALFRIKDTFVKLLFGCWLFFGVGLFAFYHKPIHIYYFEFMFPLPFFLFGNLLSQVYMSNRLRFLGKALAVGVFVGIVVLNLLHAQVRNQGNRQKEQVKSIVEFVIEKTEDKPFNFALITPGNSDHAYRYYFEVLKREPVVIDNTISDPQRKTVTKQLFVVCEDIGCKPLGHSLFEVAGFGRAEVAGEWDVSVVKVFKLVPYTEQE